MDSQYDSLSNMIDTILTKYVNNHKKGDFDTEQAISMLLRQVETLEKIQNYGLLGKIYNYIGIFEGTRGHFKESIHYFMLSGEAYLHNQNLVAVGLSYGNIAETYRLLNDVRSASEHFQLAEQTIEPLEDDEKWEVMVQNRCNEGQLWLASDNYEQAQALLEDALIIINNHKSDDWDTGVIFGFLPETHSSLARVYAYNKDFERATDHLEEAFRILKQTNNAFLLGHVYLSHAILSLNMENKLDEIAEALDTCLIHFRKANAKFELAEALLFYGNILYQNEEFALAEPKWLEASALFRSLNLQQRADHALLQINQGY